MRATGLAVLLSTALLAQNAPVGSAVKYNVDKNHSTIGFNAPILGFGKVTGKFTDFDIAIVYDEKDVTKSSVKVTIKAASVNTGIADRDAHLRTADFFDTEKFPEITFESIRVEAGKDGALVAHGTFTMRGVQKQMALPFRLKAHAPGADGRSSLGIVARTTLNRREFGVNWKHSAVPDFVGDEIEVDLAITTRLGVRGESK